MNDAAASRAAGMACAPEVRRHEPARETSLRRIATGAALALTVWLSSCATPYAPQNLTGGYSDTKVDENHYRVKFAGNGHASSERVWNFWFYRCAELTREKGSTHFTVLRPGQTLSELREPPRRLAIYRPDTAGGMINTKGGGGGVIVVPQFYGGQRITTWSSDAVVSMHRTPLPEYIVMIDAQTVLDQLAPYIKSDGRTTPVPRAELYQRAATMNRPVSDYNFGGEL